MRLKIKNQKLIVSKTNKPSGIEIVIQRKNKASFQEQTRLFDVFKFHPSGVLYKEETGIGATTLELRSLRNSIIVEPIKITASSKATQENALYVGSPTKYHPEKFSKKDSKKNIIYYNQDSTIKYKKIVVVADSLIKVIEAIGKDVYENYFLLIDEIDSFQLDSTYRKSMETCLEFYKKFPPENRAMVSATRIVFTDPNLVKEPIFYIRYDNTLNQLKDNVVDYFNNNLLSRKAEILTTIAIAKTFDSKFLGSVQYTLDKMAFNRDIFQNIADDAFNEQWKSNSLYNGAMPYSFCYGSDNSCSDFSCSQIEVFTGSSDVLVTIKDSRGKVYRHAYIKANQSFTFDIENGDYQVYFYSGEGWNPNKFISQISCGVLKGGFVNGESFTKAPQIMLYSQKMTYELILQQNGNLHTEQSSKNEAFE